MDLLTCTPEALALEAHERILKQLQSTRAAPPRRKLKLPPVMLFDAILC